MSRHSFFLKTALPAYRVKHEENTMISLKYTVDLNQDGNERGGENPESLVPLEGNINQSLATNQRRQEFREILD